jgi:hypothetical protein
VDFGLGHVGDEWSDKHSGFSLTDEGGGSGDDSLGTGNTESPEDESSEFSDEPLDESNVVERLNQGDED